jgi:hypothetical protein
MLMVDRVDEICRHLGLGSPCMLVNLTLKHETLKGLAKLDDHSSLSFDAATSALENEKGLFGMSGVRGLRATANNPSSFGWTSDRGTNLSILSSVVDC